MNHISNGLIEIDINCLVSFDSKPIDGDYAKYTKAKTRI